MKSNYLDDMFIAEEVELLVCGSQVRSVGCPNRERGYVSRFGNTTASSYWNIVQ